MAEFNVYWSDEDEKSILIWDYPPHYSMETLMTVGLQVREMLKESSAARIDIIMLLNRSNPEGASMLSMLSGAYKTMPPNVKTLIFVAPSSFGQIIIRVLNDVNEKARETTHFAESLDEALAYIKKLRDQPQIGD